MVFNWKYKASLLNIKCSYRVVNRIDDFKLSLGNYFTLNEGQQILHEVFEVLCTGFNSTSKIKNSKFENLYVQLIDKLADKSNLEENSKEGECKPMNIMLLSYDSVSKAAWHNRMPKTLDYMNNVMNFVFLNGYNIIGDGTPAGVYYLENNKINY